MTRSAAIVLFALVAGTVSVIVRPTWWGGGDAGGGGDRPSIRMVVFGMPFEDRLYEDQYARGHAALNPQVEVVYQRHSDVRAKYNAWFAKGDGAEVMRMGIDYYKQYVDREMLMPLSAFIALPEPYGLSEAELAAIPQRLRDELTVGGELYALPQDASQYGLFYNKALFDAYDAEHPEAPLGYPDATWTWADLLEAAEKLHRRDGSGRLAVAGVDMAVSYAWPFYNFFVQAGGRMWSADELTTRVDSEAGVAALELFAELVGRGVYEPSFGQEGGTGPAARFMAGRSAMLYDGSWSVPRFQAQAPELDFAVAPVPRGVRPAVPTGSVLWAISSRSAHPREGWRMIRWMLTERQAGKYWQALRVAPPANTAVMASEAFRATAGVPRLDASGEPVPRAYEVPPMPRDKYDDYAAWLRFAWEVDEASGVVPGFPMAARHQTLLDNEVTAALGRWLKSPDSHDPAELLARVAERVHGQIDADLRARGLTPPDRRADRAGDEP
jgi:multiple sugar transport system substrate-binding protein